MANKVNDSPFVLQAFPAWALEMLPAILGIKEKECSLHHCGEGEILPKKKQIQVNQNCIEVYIIN